LCRSAEMKILSNGFCQSVSTFPSFILRF